MQLGLQIPRFTWPGGASAIAPTLARIAESAESAGFAMIGVMDHFWQIPLNGSPEEPMLEAYTTLGFLAAHTEKAQLLTLVTGNPYRYPGELIKEVTTLDVLSGGRAWLGIGAGWFEEEAKGLGIGVPWPPLKERFAMLEETLQIARGMWEGNMGSQQPYHGTYYHLDRMLNSPQSIQRPHPPIMIGGSGERKTLRLVAQYADACNLFPSPELPHKLDVLKQHCQDVGRDYNAILKTAIYRYNVGENGSRVPEIIADLKNLAASGIQAVIGAVADVETIAPLEIIGKEVIPAVQEL